MHLATLVVMIVLYGLAGLAAGIGLGSLIRGGRWKGSVGSWNLAAVALAVLLAAVSFTKGADGLLWAALGGGGLVGLALGFMPSGGRVRDKY